MRHYDEHGFAGGNGLSLAAVLGREPRPLAELADSTRREAHAGLA
jgi:hypothetical protein